MTNMLIQASPRAGKTRHDLHLLRREGLVPGVVYGHQAPSRPIQVEVRHLMAVLQQASSSTVLKLSLAGGSPQNVIVKEVQYEPISRRPRHIDLQVIDMRQPVQVAIPVQLQGEPPGVKVGGVLQIGAREVTVRALPANLPEAIIVNISTLEFGQHIVVGDLTLPDGLEVITDPEQLVVCILASNTQEPDLPESEAGVDSHEPKVADEAKQQPGR